MWKHLLHYGGLYTTVLLFYLGIVWVIPIWIAGARWRGMILSLLAAHALVALCLWAEVGLDKIQGER